MSDATTTVERLKQLVQAFVAEREWEQFHTPKNLAMGVAIEAAELMEHYQWMDGDASRKVTEDAQAREAVADEMADVACYLFALSNVLNIDLSDAVTAKLVKNAEKYPVDKYRGKY